MQNLFDLMLLLKFQAMFIHDWLIALIFVINNVPGLQCSVHSLLNELLTKIKSIFAGLSHSNICGQWLNDHVEISNEW